MATRHVLTVNQVLEILLRWLEVNDWEKAFMSVIPKRKLPQAHGGEDSDMEAQKSSTLDESEDEQQREEEEGKEETEEDGDQQSDPDEDGLVRSA
jgi:tRNA (guanine9-N1)-methyltransferase